MPLNSVCEVAYQPVPAAGGIRFQANPPVCNRCWREITRQNFGCVTVVGEAPFPGRFEFIECTECTAVRACGPEVTLFWARHQC
jgi:hypothetical protein